MGKLRVDVPGTATFRRGDETILFLKPGVAGRSFITGLSLGRFEVVEDPRSKKKVVRGLTRKQLGSLGIGQTSVSGTEAAASRRGSADLEQFLGGLRELVLDTVREGGK